MEIQKNEYLGNEKKSFLDTVKTIFNNLLRAII